MIISWSFRNYIEISWKASSHAFSNPPETKIADKESWFEMLRWGERRAGGRPRAGSDGRCFLLNQKFVSRDTLLTWSLVTTNTALTTSQPRQITNCTFNPDWEQKMKQKIKGNLYSIEFIKAVKQIFSVKFRFGQTGTESKELEEISTAYWQPLVETHQSLRESWGPHTHTHRGLY